MTATANDSRETSRAATERISLESFERLTESERQTQSREKRALRGYWQCCWDVLRRDRVGMVCLAAMLMILAIALCAPLVAPFDPYEQSLRERLLNPGAAHLLGTDELGRDIFSRIVYGLRVSLAVGAFSQLLAVSAGFVIGSVAGYFGGRVDALASFLIQVFSSFPLILFALATMYVLGPGLANLYVALGLLMWTTTARLVRAEVLRLRSQEYVLACVITGGSPARVIVRHLLPSCLPTLLLCATLGVPNAILCEASLSFLGLGVQPPMASLGQMIASAQPYLVTNPWYSLAPGLAIMCIVLALNLLGDAIRDALDPRSAMS
ncbi:MAG: ABC transporter permease [Coriobacteriales bacterium]|nr:ABC transporter permease [Coriobacteriales bacterium]